MKYRCTIFNGWWTQHSFHKKLAGTRYTELVFLLPSGSVDDVVHSDPSVARKVITLVFMLGRDRYGFDKKRVGSRYAELVFLHPVGSVGHVVHSASSAVRNMIVLFFILGLDRYRLDKKRAGTRYV
jgi:hypothetical protein